MDRNEKRLKWGDNMLMYQKMQYYEDVSSPKLIYRFNTISVKIPAAFIKKKNDRVILKILHGNAKKKLAELY